MTEVMRDPRPTAGEAGPVLDQLLGDVEQVMLRAVVVLDADMRADEAARRLAAEELAAGPVLDRGRVTGMVTLTELLYWDSHPSAATGPWLRHGHEQGALRVRELMRRDIPIARATWPIARVAEVMDRSGSPGCRSCPTAARSASSPATTSSTPWPARAWSRPEPHNAIGGA